MTSLHGHNIVLPEPTCALHVPDLSLFYMAFSLESQTKYYMDVQNQDITKLAR